MELNGVRHEDSLRSRERNYHEKVYQENWRPSVVDAKEYYAEYAKPLRDGGGNQRYPQMKAQFDFLIDSPGGRILDCACGAGRHAIWMALSGKKVWAFDFSAAAIDVAKASAELSGVRDSVQFAVADVTELPYKDEFFDILTGTDCIHHLVKYEGAISELSRVLKGDGKAVFFEPLALNPVVNMLRWINIRWNKRVGEHMLTEKDIELLRNEFGSIRMTNHMVLSAFTRIFGARYTPLRGIRRWCCILLISADRALLTYFPFLKKWSAGCVIELTKADH